MARKIYCLIIQLCMNQDSRKNLLQVPWNLLLYSTYETSNIDSRTENMVEKHHAGQFDLVPRMSACIDRNSAHGWPATV